MSLSLAVKQLNNARREMEQELDGIKQAIKALGRGSTINVHRPKRHLSAAGREAISRAQRKRWKAAKKAA
jgi:hypothetical protein